MIPSKPGAARARILSNFCWTSSWVTIGISSHASASHSSTSWQRLSDQDWNSGVDGPAGKNRCASTTAFPSSSVLHTPLTGPRSVLRGSPPPRRIVFQLTEQTRRHTHGSQIHQRINGLQKAHHNHIYNGTLINTHNLTTKCNVNVSKYKNPRTRPHPIQNNAMA